MAMGVVFFRATVIIVVKRVVFAITNQNFIIKHFRV